MNIIIILGHPDPASFNHAIARAVVDALKAKGHEIRFHDLYAEGFDPVLPAAEIPKYAETTQLVKQQCDELTTADGIVVIHPNWWGSPPAIMKGWIDRVVRPGIAYEFREGDVGEGVPCGLLKIKTALVFNTSNTPEDRERNVFGDPLELIWKNCVFGLCGVTDVRRRTFNVIVTSTEEQRSEWLRDAAISAVAAFAA